MHDILFIERDGEEAVTDKAHCSDCEPPAEVVSDRAHCGDCEV